MSDFPRFFGFSDAELYMKNTAPIRGSGLIPLRRDRKNSQTYSMRWAGADICARMYHEDIVVWRQNGTILVSNYNSATTLRVQNELLPHGLWVSSKGDRKHLNSYAFISEYMELVRSATGWEPTHDSHGYCYGPGRKFFSPRMRAYYLALKRYLDTVRKLNPESVDDLEGSYQSRDAIEMYKDYTEMLDLHNWNKGDLLTPELIEAGLNYYPKTDRLSHFGRLRWEYKGTEYKQKTWTLLDYKEHLAMQTFLDKFKS